MSMSSRNTGGWTPRRTWIAAMALMGLVSLGTPWAQGPGRPGGPGGPQAQGAGGPGGPGGPATIVSPSNAQEVPLEASATTNLEKTGGAPMGNALTAANVLASTTSSGPLATVVCEQQAIEQVIDKLRKQTGVTVRAKGKTAGEKVSLREVKHALEVILDAVCKQKNWRWVKRPDGSYDLYDQEAYADEVLSQRVQRKEFVLKYIDVEDFEKVVSDMLTSGLGTSATDGRTNKLIVTDMPDKLALIESIIREYDVQLYTRVFEVNNVAADDVASKLEDVKTKNSTITVDTKNHLVVVKDERLDKLKVMEQLIGLFDRDQEICVYNLSGIGKEGADAEDFVTAFIEPLVTQDDATLEFNKATSLLYVRDVRSVHKKILEIIEQLDRPRKQVLIEGEMLQVTVSNDLSFGVSWNFADNLVNAVSSSGISSLGGTIDGTKQAFGSLSASGLSVTAMNDKVQAQLSSALTDTRTRVLLKPMMILGNHKEGSINITKQDPILTTYVSDSTTNSYTTSSQTFIDSGLIITIVPAISNRGLVELTVSFEDSSSFTATLSDSTTGVGKNTQKASTEMIVPSGHMRVIGGLITHDLSSGSTGIPVLSQIPYLGALFGKKTKTDKLSNLLFFVTPTILETAPLNDVIAEPVNDMARLAMLQDEKAVAEPKNVNAVPDSLKPYLEQIRPRALAYPEKAGDEVTSGTMSEAALTSATLASEAALKAGNALIKSGEPPSVALNESGDVVKVGGAGIEKSKALGPSGAFASNASSKGMGGAAKSSKSLKKAAGTDASGKKAKRAGSSSAKRSSSKNKSSSSTSSGSTSNRSSSSTSGLSSSTTSSSVPVENVPSSAQ